MQRTKRPGPFFLDGGYVGKPPARNWNNKFCVSGGNIYRKITIFAKIHLPTMANESFYLVWLDSQGWGASHFLVSF